MMPLPKDKNISYRVYLLIFFRIVIKLLILGIALLLHAGYLCILILLFLICISELYKNAASLLIQKGGSAKLIGALVSALDGAVLIFSLYFANALGTDLYLFILLSIALNTSEYGLLSAIVEGIVAGFSYAIFILASTGTYDSSFLFSTYVVRISFIVFLGWITGWLASDLYDKENKLKLVLENDIYEEELNQMKSTFVSDAAESFKTPISAIKGYIDIMVNGRMGELDDKIKEYLRNISKNIIKVDSLVDELLHIIEIEDDSIKLKRKIVNTCDFVKTLKEDADAFSRIYNANITFKDELVACDKISIDEFRLKIAIKNLLYYIFDVSGKEVMVIFRNQNNNLIISVRAEIKNLHKLEIFDDSIDLKDEVMKNSTLKVYTSKLIVESHEGRIEVKRSEGDYVTFIIYLPY